jgi:hypothetical protein
MKHKKIKYIKYCFGIIFVNDFNKSSLLLSEMDIQLSKGTSILKILGLLKDVMIL